MLNLLAFKTISFLLIMLIGINCKKNTAQPNDTSVSRDLNSASACPRFSFQYRDSQLDNKNDIYSASFQCGKNREVLIENALAFYNNYLLILKKALPSRDSDPMYFDDLNKRISNIKSDIKVINFSPPLAILEHSRTAMDYLSFYKFQDIWIYKVDHWEPLLTYQNTISKIKLVDLNGDSIQDALVWGGCCDNIQIDFLIGSNQNVLEHVDKLELSGNVTLKNQGVCDRMQIQYRPFNAENNEKPDIYRYDCKSNKIKLREDI